MPWSLLRYFADDPTCSPHSFFGIPSWYEYVYKAGHLAYNKFTGACEFKELSATNPFGDLSLIGLGILDILLRLAGLISVAFIIYAGVLYITSQGEPEKAKRAQSTIVNAL